MKILIVTSGFPVENQLAGVFLPDLIREFNRRGNTVHVLTQNCRAKKRESLELHSGCEVTFFRWSGGFLPLVDVLKNGVFGYFLAAQYFLSGIWTGFRTARKWKPDFILAEWVVPSGILAFGISRLTGVPYATRSLGSDVELARRNKWVGRIARFVARRAKALFADGFELGDKTSELAGGRPCHFAPTHRRMGKARSDFRPLDDAGRFTTCTVGRLHRVKGHDVLIDAAALLKENGPPFRCYIVGEGAEKEALEKQIHEARLEDSVFLTGRLEDGDVADLLAHADAAVIPSRSESIPLALGEALSAGKPLVVADVGDMGYLVRKHGLGSVVPPEDPEALAEALREMSGLPDRRRFLGGQKEVLALLSVENAADVILEHMGS